LTPLALEQRIGARWATWVGVLSLVITVGLLLRWTFENNVIGPAGRVALGLVSGVLLLGAGQALHRRRDLPFLSEGLAGGGLAILYLSLYAAHALYGFIGTGAAFGLMAAVTVLGIVVAVVSGRQATAVLAVLGGLLTPILVSTDHPDERVLLGYLFVLDLLVLGIARYRAWMGLNHLAWAGTVALFLPLLMKQPASPDPVVRLVLLSLLAALFLAVPLFQAWIERRRVIPLDLALVTGNAAAYFSAVYVTLEPFKPTLEAPYAVTLAAVYVLIARRHKLRVPEDDPTVGLHLGIAVVLVTLAFPLAFDGPWVTLAWAAQGVVSVWIAMRRVRSMSALAGGIAVLGCATARAALLDFYWYKADAPIWNVAFAVHLLVVVALAVAGWLAVRPSGATRGVPLESGDLRSSLWFGAAGLLSVLLWREPTGLWSAGLLILEMLALAWLARARRDPAFVLTTLLLAGIVLARLFIEDADLARGAASSLVNAPLLLRIAACAAIAFAGRQIERSDAMTDAQLLGRILRGVGGVVLLCALSIGWFLHQDVALDAARAEGDGELARHLRWKLQVGLSILWTLYAAAALAWGFVRSIPAVRYGALALFGIVVGKVFLVDLAELQAVYRILSFFVLGLVLLGVSYLYQRSRPIDR
jgi:hypothetical protein